MKKKLLLFIFLLFGYPSFSQTDSLIKQLALAKNNSQKINILTDLGMIYTHDGKFEKAIESFKKAVVLVKKQGTPAVEASLYNEIGNAEADMGNNSPAFNAYQKALKIIPDTALSLKAKIYKNIGAVFLSWKNLNRALYYYQRSLSFAKLAHDHKTVADCYNNMGTV
ncbi:tetratricopeptide repeat protein, partial [Pedobacter glucosidilyticus]|uniref:tetratricopeptide repeat protein n=1 Tax=Pedobacter glucosidilyticus TaxID=1122941 RepID=UPI0026F008C5